MGKSDFFCVGDLDVRQPNNSQTDNGTSYIVVTIILGTADDDPLFDKIHTRENLQNILFDVASMQDDYLMKCELLWTPRQSNEYLTEEALLTEYTDIILL